MTGLSQNTGKTSYCGFVIDNRELIWQHVYDSAVEYDDAMAFYKQLTSVYELSGSDNFIIGDIRDLIIDFRRYGGTWGNTSMVVQGYNLDGKIKIEGKEEKYRVTIFGLKMIPNINNALFQESDFSVYMLKNKRDAIRPTCATPDILGIYDKFFQDYFKVRSLKRSNSDW
jgi:hypothetical protein